MTRSKVPSALHHSGHTVPGRYPARHAVAFALRAASAALDRLAQRVATPAATHEPGLPPELEFYAQAGAPEGALYVDGQFVGYIRGVQRL